MIPAFPAWDGVSTLFAFFLTSILLGPLFVAAILAIKGELNFNITVLSICPSVHSCCGGWLFFIIACWLPEAVETARLTFQHVFFWFDIVTLSMPYVYYFYPIKIVN